jgi:cysteine-rich repeat protein
MRLPPASITLLASLALTAGCGDDSTAADTTTGDSGDGSTTDAPTATNPSTTTATTGNDTTTATETGADSTGAGSVCGDDLVEGDEQCDDGDVEDGDACYSNCTIAYEVAWEISLDMGVANDNGIEGVTDAEGNIYVAGATDVAVGDSDIWVQQITPDGRPGWSFTYAGVVGGDDFASSIEWLEGDLIVGGQVSAFPGYDAIVLRIDPSDQSVVWDATFDGPADAENDDRIRDLAIGADGTIAVGGTLSVDGEDGNAWTATLDGTGALQWERFRNGAASDIDTTLGVAVAADGTVHAIGWELSGSGQLVGFRAAYDATGTELANENVQYLPIDIAIDPSRGAIAVVGAEVSGATLDDCMVRVFDASYTEQWVTHVNGAGNSTDQCNGVTVGPEGDLYVAGFTTEIGRQDNYWVGRFRASGELLWANAYNNAELDISEFANYLVVDDDGNAIGIGRENQFGEGINLFMRKYTQGPPPA